MDIIFQPFPWYIAGPLIALVMFAMHYVGDGMGISTNFKTMCSMSGAGKYCSFFDSNWKDQAWNITFILGVVFGGFLSANFLEIGDIELADSFKEVLAGWNLSHDGNSLFPKEIFSWDNLFSGNGWFFMLLGPFLVGFGARYAQGCTSGHAISGLSNLQLPSLIAVIGFFIGGLFVTHIVLPLIF
ncbi:MAG: YeeE/YedE family protein [Flavobacteriales bacterium]|jgi:uncharacterized membrane protein YedE/YeeE|nr:YeeE/YedE family protein [Flavobacteriales bacterium]